MLKLKQIQRIKEPFQLEKTYFEENIVKFSDEIQSRLDGKLTLATLSKKSQSAVPTNYFSDFEARIKVVNKPIELSFQRFWPRKRTIFSSAAAVGLIGVLTWLSFPKNQGKIEDGSFGAISSEEMYVYLQSQELPVEEVLMNKDISKIESDSLIINNLQFNRRDIVKYLEENNAEIEI